MSSIRPIATIVFLAAVCLILYMKINETEPPLPEGVENWSVSADIDMDESEADGGDRFAPQIDFGNAETATTTSAGTAPAFQSSDEASTTAPTWSDGDIVAEPAADASAATAPRFSVTTPDEENSSSPSIPDLPTVPGSAPNPAETASPYSATTANVDVPHPAAPSVSPDEVPSADQRPTTSHEPNASAAEDSQQSLFSATRRAVQAALDRGELSQGLLLLSDWYGDPSLSAAEQAELENLLSQLAGSVIYSTEPRLEPPYMVQSGERLEEIAKKYEVPWQLLAKINGIGNAEELQPGQELKVMRGPFSAVIDLDERRLTLMLDRRYAGKFDLELDSNSTVEEGEWTVSQKLLAPTGGQAPAASSSEEDRSLMLTNTSGQVSKVAILRGPGAAPTTADPTSGRVIRLQGEDIEDVFDILSLGSRVIIRR